MRLRTAIRSERLVPAAVVAATVVLVVRDQGGYFPPSWGWSGLALAGVVVTWILASARTDAGRFDAFFFLALLALTAWGALSIAWSVDPAQSVLEFERGLVLLAGCAALLVLARRGGVEILVFTLLASIAAICAFSLWTRVMPTADAFHSNDPVSRYRLAGPVGYWNGLGILAVLGTLLALGLATEPVMRFGGRLLAALALVVLPVTLFFTFSRGAWLALIVGLLVSVAASPHRLRLTAESAVFAVLPVAALALAWRAGPLTHKGSTFAAAARAGHRLAIELLILVVASAAVVLLVRWLEGRVRIGTTAGRLVGSTLVALVLAGVALGLIHSGGPVRVAKHAYHSFADPIAPRDRGNLTSRLASLNGNGRARMWEVALASLHGGEWTIGRGAGSFERNWDRSTRADEVVRDAHGLYVETLSELGVIGLVLLLAALAIPLAVGLRRRANPLVAALAGAYGAFLTHLAVDWDWELSGIALSGLFVGCLLLVVGRDGPERLLPRGFRVVGAAAGVAAAGFAFVGLAGNTALARAQAADRDHRFADAAAAATAARRWMPWSSAPLQELGKARLNQGDAAGARASFRAAINLDPNNWQSWLDLAASLEGKERRRAVARARQLYPRSPEIAEFEKEVRALKARG